MEGTLSLTIAKLLYVSHICGKWQSCDAKASNLESHGRVPILLGAVKEYLSRLKQKWVHRSPRSKLSYLNHQVENFVHNYIKETTLKNTVVGQRYEHLSAPGSRRIMFPCQTLKRVVSKSPKTPILCSFTPCVLSVHTYSHIHSISCTWHCGMQHRCCNGTRKQVKLHSAYITIFSPNPTYGGMQKFTGKEQHFLFLWQHADKKWVISLEMAHLPAVLWPALN